MKLTLDKPLIDLDEKPIYDNGKPAKMFHVVAKALATAERDNPVKCYDLALKFYSGVPVEVDDADFDFVKDCIITSRFFQPLTKGPILKEMDVQKLAANAVEKK